MNKKMKITKYLLFFLICHFINAQDRKPNVTIEGFETMSIYSKSVNEDYNLYIGLPFGYNKGKSYKVLYILDANVTFGMVNDIVKLLSFEKKPQVIVVGVAYKNFNNWIKKRGRDFMPNYQGVDLDAEVIKFYTFMTTELIPYINKTYNTKPTENTIYGHSSGAVFGLYAMFKNPTLFKNYILTSPSVDEDKDFIKTFENEYFSNNKTLNVNLYTSIGKSEKSSFVTTYNAFVKNLKTRTYKGLNFHEEELEGTHMSTMAPAFIKGFQYVNKFIK